jgi:hypothetical protein
LSRLLTKFIRSGKLFACCNSYLNFSYLFHFSLLACSTQHMFIYSYCSNCS